MYRRQRSYTPNVVWPRCASVLPAAAFAMLAAVLVLWGDMPAVEGLWATVAVALAFVPSGLAAPNGWRRRAAEAALLPAAYAFTLLADPTMRRMVFPVLFLVAAGAAAVAAFRRCPAHHHPLLLVSLALALRAAGGLGLTEIHPIPAALAVVTPAVFAWTMSRFLEPAPAFAATLIVAALPLQAMPRVGLTILAVLVILLISPLPRAAARFSGRVLLPGSALIAAFLLTLSPWGCLPPGQLFPQSTWVILAVLGVAVVSDHLFGRRIPAAAVGAFWLGLTIFLGPIQPPPPDSPAVGLSSSSPAAVLPAAGDSLYLMDVSLAYASAVPQDTPVAILSWDDQALELTAGTHAVEWAARRADVARRLAHQLPTEVVWRPSGSGGTALFAASGRSTPAVPAGTTPVIERHWDLPENVTVTVAAGPSRATPPRTWSLTSWLVFAAVAVAGLQLLGRGWDASSSWLPWTVLAIGSTVARAPVEPLRLLAERHAPDLALAALLIAWTAAAVHWLRHRRTLLAAATLLVPLAVATPMLTPPLMGDEPFHLALMETILQHRSFDLVTHAGFPPELAHLSAPTLALMLLPAYVLAARTGALMVMALAGALLVSLLDRRAAQVGINATGRTGMMLALLLTLPVAVFSTQLWVEIPGALIAAVLLVHMGNGGRRLGWAMALVATATALKTRLLLAVLPVAAAQAPQGRRQWRRIAAVLALAAGAGMALAWVTQGHPFGPFRRLVHLLPANPVQPVIVLAGLLFDSAAGMLVTVPLGLLAVAGLPKLWCKGGPGERGLILGLGATVVLLLHSHEWYGGGSPPIRYLVPFLPALALAAVMLIRHRRWTRHVAVVFAPPAFLAWWVLATRPHLSINAGDGSSWPANLLARRLAADAGAFFPSYLRPNAAALTAPLVIAGIAAGLYALSRWRPGVIRRAARVMVALWLVAAATLVAAVRLRPDRVVQFEAAQVLRLGGAPHPPEGTFSRFMQPNGWRLTPGDGVMVPLHLPAGARVLIHGWCDGPDPEESRILGRWDDGPLWQVAAPQTLGDGVLLPPPSDPDRNELTLHFDGPAGVSAVLDRLEVKR